MMISSWKNPIPLYGLHKSISALQGSKDIQIWYLAIIMLSTKGFCQVKKNPKIQEKHERGWVYSSPNSDSCFFLEMLCFFVVFLCCFFCFTCFKKN